MCFDRRVHWTDWAIEFVVIGAGGHQMPRSLAKPTEDSLSWLQPVEHVNVCVIVRREKKESGRTQASKRVAPRGGEERTCVACTQYVCACVCVCACVACPAESSHGPGSPTEKGELVPKCSRLGNAAAIYLRERGSEEWREERLIEAHQGSSRLRGSRGPRNLLQA